VESAVLRNGTPISASVFIPSRAVDLNTGSFMVRVNAGDELALQLIRAERDDVELARGVGASLTIVGLD